MDEENYIRKITDETMLLPLILQAAEIWPEYLTKLGEVAQFIFDYNIQQLLILEDSTLQNRDQLDYYLQREFFNPEKIGRVQLTQQFIIMGADVHNLDISAHFQLTIWIMYCCQKSSMTF